MSSLRSSGTSRERSKRATFETQYDSNLEQFALLRHAGKQAGHAQEEPGQVAGPCDGCAGPLVLCDALDGLQDRPENGPVALGLGGGRGRAVQDWLKGTWAAFPCTASTPCAHFKHQNARLLQPSLCPWQI